MSTQRPRWLRQYVFSLDHKTIGIAIYDHRFGDGDPWAGISLMYFAFSWLFPNQAVPGFGLVGPDEYNRALTMHGTIMVFWVAMPILLSGFGNYLLPIMIGARDMAFPRLNMLSYWVFLLSSVVLIASFFVPGGAAAGGWTFYPPLSAGFG